jgi:hypothetical protein
VCKLDANLLVLRVCKLDDPRKGADMFIGPNACVFRRYTTLREYGSRLNEAKTWASTDDAAD